MYFANHRYTILDIKEAERQGVTLWDTSVNNLFKRGKILPLAGNKFKMIRPLLLFLSVLQHTEIPTELNKGINLLKE